MRLIIKKSKKMVIVDTSPDEAEKIPLSLRAECSDDSLGDLLIAIDLLRKEVEDRINKA